MSISSVHSCYVKVLTLFNEFKMMVSFFVIVSQVNVHSMHVQHLNTNSLTVIELDWKAAELMPKSGYSSLKQSWTVSFGSF